MLRTHPLTQSSQQLAEETLSSPLQTTGQTRELTQLAQALHGGGQSREVGSCSGAQHLTSQTLVLARSSQGTRSRGRVQLCHCNSPQTRRRPHTRSGTALCLEGSRLRRLLNVPPVFAALEPDWVLNSLSPAQSRWALEASSSTGLASRLEVLRVACLGQPGRGPRTDSLPKAQGEPASNCRLLTGSPLRA